MQILIKTLSLLMSLYTTITLLKIPFQHTKSIVLEMTTILKSIPGVINAKVNLLNEEAEVMTSFPVAETTFRDVISTAGYKLNGIK
jgi:copper chaperone CopZ